jgi:hypothetical protein
MTYYSDEAFPALSDEQWARLQAYGSAQELESGALVSGVGEATYNLILVDSGEAEVIRAATSQAAEAVVARFGTAQFAGELSLPTGQATYLSSRSPSQDRSTGSTRRTGCSASPSTIGPAPSLVRQSRR